jgi:hypothetical protein
MSDAALLACDRHRVAELEHRATPPDAQALIDAARLLMRYGATGFGADLHHRLLTVLQRWQLSTSELHARTRALWSQGWRPPLTPTTQLEGVNVGSGADVGS